MGVAREQLGLAYAPLQPTLDLSGPRFTHFVNEGVELWPLTFSSGLVEETGASGGPDVTGLTFTTLSK